MSALNPVPPAKELVSRMIRFGVMLRERNIAAALIVDERNVRYLSGFTGSESALLITGDARYLLTDFRFIEEAAKTAKGWTVVIEPQGLMEKAGAVARKHAVEHLAVEPGAMRLTDVAPLKKALQNIKIKSEHGMVGALRLFKTDWEIERIEKALRIQEAAFEKLCANLKEGSTEREAAETLRHELILGGADDQAFETMFQIGRNTSLPHGRPTQRALKDGSLVLVDWGARLSGYHTDLTRTFFWGKIPAQLCKVHSAVLQAQHALIERIAPGECLADLDKAAHAVIDRAGYKAGFRHSAGHGIGLEIHEYPAISEHSRGLVREGMLLAIEPGVYLPGVAGIRVEDMVLVTRNGCRVLSRLKHGLRWDGSDS